MKMPIDPWWQEFLATEGDDLDPAVRAAIASEVAFVRNRLFPLVTRALASSPLPTGAELSVIGEAMFPRVGRASESSPFPAGTVVTVFGDATPRAPVFAIEALDHRCTFVVRGGPVGWTLTVAHGGRFDDADLAALATAGFEATWKYDGDPDRYYADQGWGDCDFAGFPYEYQGSPLAEGQRRFSIALADECELYTFVWLLLDRAAHGRADRPAFAGGPSSSSWPLLEGPREAVTETQLVAFEQASGHVLPLEYRAFVLARNGGHPVHGQLVEHDAIVDYVIPLLSPMSYAMLPPFLHRSNDQWRDHAPEFEGNGLGPCLAVATDDRRGIVFLALSGARRGEVWRLDGRRAADRPSEIPALTVLARSWRAFLRGLRPNHRSVAGRDVPARASCDDLDRFFDRELDAGRATAFRAHMAVCRRCPSLLLGRMLERDVIDRGDVRDE
ncbi:MAG TPA: SMI1/KNR4 family protein [Kofleriaceae bacterium]|jgi:hypothetical protein